MYAGLVLSLTLLMLSVHLVFYVCRVHAVILSGDEVSAGNVTAQPKLQHAPD